MERPLGKTVYLKSLPLYTFLGTSENKCVCGHYNKHPSSPRMSSNSLELTDLRRYVSCSF